MLAILGIDGPWVSLAYVLCILSSLACVIYGVANWNKGAEDQSLEDVEWNKEEAKIEEEL